jgi:hypothetical protein
MIEDRRLGELLETRETTASFKDQLIDRSLALIDGNSPVRGFPDDSLPR